MNEAAQFEIYEKKLQGVCDENNLIYTFNRNSYPVSLTVRPSGDFDGQLSLLENEKENEYTSVNASLRIFYNEGDQRPTYRFSEDYTMSDTLLRKLTNLFANMYTFWHRFFFRDVMENHRLQGGAVPDIEEAADLPADYPEDDDPLDELMEKIDDPAPEEDTPYPEE